MERCVPSFGIYPARHPRAGLGYWCRKPTCPHMGHVASAHIGYARLPWRHYLTAHPPGGRHCHLRCRPGQGGGRRFVVGAVSMARSWSSPSGWGSIPSPCLPLPHVATTATGCPSLRHRAQPIHLTPMNLSVHGIAQGSSECDVTLVVHFTTSRRVDSPPSLRPNSPRRLPQLRLGLPKPLLPSCLTHSSSGHRHINVKLCRLPSSSRTSFPCFPCHTATPAGVIWFPQRGRVM